MVGQGSAGGRMSDDGTEGWTSVETDGQEADRWREDGASGRESCRKCQRGWTWQQQQLTMSRCREVPTLTHHFTEGHQV